MRWYRCPNLPRGASPFLIAHRRLLPAPAARSCLPLLPHWRNISRMPNFHFSRRSFLAVSVALPWALRGLASALASSKSIPVGLELYSVRDSLKKDPEGTVRAVAGMGYQVVEFYGPYFEWSEAQAKDMRKLMDGLGIRCLSTHNDEANFSDARIGHT